MKFNDSTAFRLITCTPFSSVDVRGQERRGSTTGKIDHTALDLYGAVLRIEWIVVQIHHASQGRRESHAISDRSVSGQPDEFITLGHVVQETANKPKTNTFSFSTAFYILLSYLSQLTEIQDNLTYRVFQNYLYKLIRLFDNKRENLQNAFKIFKTYFSIVIYL